jgi:hypothetical protein
MTELIPAVYDENHKNHTAISHQAFTLAQAINSPGTYQAAAVYLLDVKAMRKKWAETIKPAVKAAHEAHKRIKDVETLIDAPLAKAENEYLKPALAKFEMAEESRRREDQERINRDLRKQDEDRRLELAAELEKSGKKAEAAAVIDAPPAPEVVIPKTTEMKGISYRTRYYAEVVDKQKLIIKVAAALAPMEFVEPNMTVLNGIASTMKESVAGQWAEWGLALRTERIVSAGGR